jgi:DNA (cytosine-5)-methyltransferase 1
MFKVLDLFSGIGGFSLGLERTGGFKTIAFCEIEPFCQKVLAKHWPGVPIYNDIKELTAERLLRDGISADVICGGFPCQDISTAGKGAGIDGERSGLWSEYARLIGELRPRYAIVENVSALLVRGIDRVLGDLAEIGFDAEWYCIPASAVGAPHRRDRFWLVAYSNGDRCDDEGDDEEGAERPSRRSIGALGEQWAHPSRRLVQVADADLPRLEGWLRRGLQERAGERAAWAGGAYAADAYGEPPERSSIAWSEYHPWLAEPDVGRVAHGVPSRVDRLKALGNAVVPQIPELIGRAILAAEDASC